MDVTLTRARTVKARIAAAWLESKSVSSALGSVTLAAHQMEAALRVGTIIREFGGALLADEAGMGKTYAALAIARDYHATTVVAPAALRAMWMDALAMTQCAANFVSLESLSRRRVDPIAGTSLVIVDEAHHARNPRTKRYDALSRLTMGSRVLLLSATPVHNRVNDLRSALALFLGARAFTLGEPDLSRLVVRRGRPALSGNVRLPALSRLTRLPVPRAPTVLHAIVGISPPVPPADGGAADALVRLGLIRAWTSSDAALRASLRRRLQHASALLHALEAGRFPTRRELAAWTTLDDAVQLAFPELMAGTVRGRDIGGLRAALASHRGGIHEVLTSLDAEGGSDAVRAEHLRGVRDRHPGSRIVAFTQFAETARALYQLLRRDGGVALVTAAGALISSGTVRRSEIIARFERACDVSDPRLPLSLLIATDVLSEGLNLQGANVLVHLDLPWTLARIEQRVGRVRRIGSGHDRVHTYAMTPANTREVSTVIRALQRKARIVASLTGTPSSAHLELLGEERRVIRRTPDGGGLADAVERIRSLLRSWMRDPKGASVDPHQLPLWWVLCGLSTQTGWRALALAECAGRLRFAALAPGVVEEHPRQILRVARLVASASEARGHRYSRDALATGTDALLAARRWIAELRGGVLAAPALHAPSAAHAKALRRIAELTAHAPRHERNSVAEVAARCRLLLRAARGAGAERTLIDWLEAPAVRVAAGQRDCQTHLERLVELLRPLGAPPCAENANVYLIALLVLHRA